MLRKTMVAGCVVAAGLATAGTAHAEPVTCTMLASAITSANATAGTQVLELPSGSECVRYTALPTITDSLEIRGGVGGERSTLRWQTGKPANSIVKADGTGPFGYPKGITVKLVDLTVTGTVGGFSAIDVLNADFEGYWVHAKGNSGDGIRVRGGSAFVGKSELLDNGGAGARADRLTFARTLAERNEDGGVATEWIRAGLGTANDNRDAGFEAPVVTHDGGSVRGNLTGIRATQSAVVGTSGNSSTIAGNQIGVDAPTVTSRWADYDANGTGIRTSGRADLANTSFHDNGSAVRAGSLDLANVTSLDQIVSTGQAKVNFSTVTSTLQTGALSLRNSIVDDCAATSSTGSYNSSTDPECPGRIHRKDPGLLGLTQDPRGSWMRPLYLPLADTSPLIDRIPASECNLVTDTRGLPRPEGGGCEPGAVEFRY